MEGSGGLQGGHILHNTQLLSPVTDDNDFKLGQIEHGFAQHSIDLDRVSISLRAHE